ncbi:MAG: UDP-N-acetylmuramate dehydrogenase [Firmicutes bacterium]|nr:UDP-N-acetylmuramate dehydrogenase [Bacillota bacterium]
MLSYFDTTRSVFLFEEPLSRHTSFRVGGPAEIFVKPKSTEEFSEIWHVCGKHGIPLTILGDGTNVLVADAGLRGIIVSTNMMNEIELLENNCIRAQAGARLSKVAETACKAGLAGFEFASGIPGTVGGAVYMNAGAYGHEIGEFCESVTLLKDSVFTKPGTEMEFGYRKSIIQQGDMLVLEAVFQLSPGNEDDIRAKMTELNNRRRQSQPLDFPSAGSTFKRPPGHFAGKLIQDSGLKGFTIGGAQVSEKHAGFVINIGNATAQDIFDVIKAVRNRVYDNFNIWLEPEVKLLGFGGEECVL